MLNKFRETFEGIIENLEVPPEVKQELFGLLEDTCQELNDIATKIVNYYKEKILRRYQNEYKQETIEKLRAKTAKYYNKGKTTKKSKILINPLRRVLTWVIQT